MALGRHEEVAAACAEFEDLEGKFEWHLAWHRALVALGAGRFAEALGLFRTRCGPKCNRGADHLALADTVGFMWSYATATGEPSPPETSAADLFARTSGLPKLPFVQLHRALLAAATRAGRGPGPGESRELCVDRSGREAL